MDEAYAWKPWGNPRLAPDFTGFLASDWYQLKLKALQYLETNPSLTLPLSRGGNLNTFGINRIAFCLLVNDHIP
ncbi:MAG: hypothetical protein RLP02_13735, partial [Coleofasciculus sp. C2-GNP5-27]